MGGTEHATLGVIILTIILVGPLFWYIRLARVKGDLFVRRLAGVDAIDDAVGRAAELGRPVVFSTGLASIGPVLYACLGVVSYVARKIARYKIRFLLPQVNPEVMAITEDTVRSAYRAEGKSGLYDPQSIQFLSDEQFAFAAGYMGLVQRENVATAFLFGSFAAEALILAEAGQTVGAMQVAATVSPEQVAFFVCACDYTLIGEELFGAAAYLSREPIQLGSLYAQDRAKLVLLTIVVVGIAIATWNSVFPERVMPNIDALITAELW